MEKQDVRDVTIREIESKSILSTSNLPIAGWSANPYVGCPHACRYCYACFMKRFTGHNEPWGAFVDVKHWEPIRKPRRYEGQAIIIGSVTDPYNPLEERCERTRELLLQLRGSGARLIIVTKSDLIMRDIDLILSFDDPIVAWSVNTLDEFFREDMDRAPSIERRLSAMKAFHERGARTCCFVSPIFPEVTDVPAIIERVSPICDYIWLENLNLRGSFKSDIMDYVAERHPELEALYRDIFLKSDDGYWKALDGQIREIARRKGYPYVVDEEPFGLEGEGRPVIINYFYHEKIRQSSKSRG